MTEEHETVDKMRSDESSTSSDYGQLTRPVIPRSEIGVLTENSLSLSVGEEFNRREVSDGGVLDGVVLLIVGRLGTKVFSRVSRLCSRGLCVNCGAKGWTPSGSRRRACHERRSAPMGIWQCDFSSTLFEIQKSDIWLLTYQVKVSESVNFDSGVETESVVTDRGDFLVLRVSKMS